MYLRALLCAALVFSAYARLSCAHSIPLSRVPRQQGTIPGSLNGRTSLFSVHEYSYLAQMNVGSQRLPVIFDTGSSDLWVISSDCAQDDCRGVPGYKPSSTLNMSNVPFRLNYLLGSVTGTVATETVTLGSYEISSQVFALANNTNGLGLSGTGNSGILGLSFPIDAAIPRTSGVTLLENLLAAFNESNRFFSFKLGSGASDSSLSFGELDPTYASSMDTFTITPVYPLSGSTYDYWKLPLRSLTINSVTFPLSKSSVDSSPTPIAVLDTGTTLILGPSNDVERFWKSVGGARKTAGGWQVRCDRRMMIGFVLGNEDTRKEYLIDPTDVSWIQGGREDDWCMGGIQANDGVSSGDWLLGDTFLRSVYAVHQVATGYQPPKIGLLSTINITNALASFRVERGEDHTLPVPVLNTITGRLGEGVIWGISAAGGFVFGTVSTTILYLCFFRLNRKY